MIGSKVAEEHQYNNGETVDIRAMVILFGVYLLWRAVDSGADTGAENLVRLFGRGVVEGRKIFGVFADRLEHTGFFGQTVVNDFA